MAQIGWIDFSPQHRERVAAVLDLLRPEGVVDELGLGSIRDAFADRMFPGISTIETRAKYFFIIPYILYEYQLLSPAKQRNKTPERYLEEREYEVMWELADSYGHKDGSGVIGITKYRPQKIMRRPSTIYWNGLSTYGLIQHGGLGVNTFLRSRSERPESLVSEILMGDDAPRDDADVDFTNRFNLKVPYEKAWSINLTLDLTREEADLLSHRMRSASRGMLLSALLDDKPLYKIFKQTNKFADFAKFVTSDTKANNDIGETVTLAHDFSELMYGAHLAYNSILQSKKFGEDAFADEWSAWAENLRINMIDYIGFNPDKVFALAQAARAHTRIFVYKWWDFVSSSDHQATQRNELIEEQEFRTKLVKARIKQNKYDDVKEEKWVGLTKFEYRMPQAKQIIQDVYSGLERK